MEPAGQHEERHPASRTAGRCHPRASEPGRLSGRGLLDSSAVPWASWKDRLGQLSKIQQNLEGLRELSGPELEEELRRKEGREGRGKKRHRRGQELWDATEGGTLGLNWGSWTSCCHSSGLHRRVLPGQGGQTRLSQVDWTLRNLEEHSDARCFGECPGLSLVSVNRLRAAGVGAWCTASSVTVRQLGNDT